MWGRRNSSDARRRLLFAILATVGILAGAGTVVAVLSGGRPAGPAEALGSAPPATSRTPVPSVSRSASPSPSASRSEAPPAHQPAIPAGGGRLLFGVGDQASGARRSALVQQAPVKMLTSWYNGPNDLTRLIDWRTGTIAQSYAAGFALHVVVWTNDPEEPLSTAYGPACGRAYPLSSRFVDDMRELAQDFAGKVDGPPLYVTLFTEFQTFPCQDNAWSPDAATTNYYRALQDQYRAAYRTLHQYAPNAKVSLGWGGWQAGWDSPASGGGRSLFAHFADVMRMSDFQSFQAMDNTSNIANIRAMVGILGRYGPVMLAHYKPDSAAQSTFDADLHTIFTDAFLTAETKAGLFAMSFMDTVNLDASPASLAFARAAVTRYGRGW